MDYDRRYVKPFPHLQGTYYFPSSVHDHEGSGCQSFSHACVFSDAHQAPIPHKQVHQHVSLGPGLATQQAKVSSGSDLSPPRRIVESATQIVAGSSPTKPMPSAPATRGDSSLPTPRKTLTDERRLEMCEYAEKNPSLKQTEIGEIFGVERSTVSKVLRNKDKYIGHDDPTRPRRTRTSSKPDIERALLVWIKKYEESGITLLSDTDIRTQLRQFIAASGGRTAAESRFNDHDWLEKFKSENSIVTVPDADSKKSVISPKAEISSPEGKDQVLVSRVKLEGREERSTKRYRPRKRKHKIETPPSTTVSSSPMPPEVATVVPPPPWPSQSAQLPCEWQTDTGTYRHLPLYAGISQDYYQNPPALMMASSYPTTSYPSHLLSQTSYPEQSPQPSASALGTYHVQHSLPLSHCPIPGREHYLGYYHPDIAKMPDTLPESPTVDQATHALQTLQRYLKYKPSALNDRELETIQQMESVKLQPLLPNLRSPSTGHCNSASPNSSHSHALCGYN